MFRAWRVREYGEPVAVLRLEEAAVPMPRSGEVRVRIAAASCNFADVLLCRGKYQQRPNPPFTPGLEVCGWVVDVGDDVDAALVGERVVGQPTLPHGGFAECALLNAGSAFRVPDDIDDATAATLHLTYLTAWLGLHRRASIAAGDVVVVTAAAGGVGSAAVQVARAAGATVIAIVSNAAKAETVARLGADVVLDSSADDVIARVRTAAPRGADIVFDAVGGDAYHQATKYIAFEGRIVIVGFASGGVPRPELTHAFVKNYTIAGLHWTLYRTQRPELVGAGQAAIFDMARAGHIQPLITQIGLDDVPHALEELAHGRAHGKTVVVV